MNDLTRVIIAVEKIAKVVEKINDRLCEVEKFMLPLSLGYKLSEKHGTGIKIED